MSTHENISVNPEALKNLAHPYHSAAGDYDDLTNRLDGIAARYDNPWGNDQTGQQFGPQFRQGLQILQQQAGAMRDTLDYYGDGLRDTSKLYTSAANDAEDAGHALGTSFEQLNQITNPPPASGTQSKELRRTVDGAVDDDALLERPGQS